MQYDETSDLFRYTAIIGSNNNSKMKRRLRDNNDVESGFVWCLS